MERDCRLETASLGDDDGDERAIGNYMACYANE